MKSSRSMLRGAVAAAVLLSAVLLSASAWAQTQSFTMTYTGQGSGSSTCNTTYNISGQEPTSGTHPVFIWTVGTGENYTDGLSTTIVGAAASRGFVAASVQYNSGTFASCSTMVGKAKCIYNGSSASSAVAKLCSRATADCSKGIVVAGLSQGSIMADLSNNSDSRIRAAWGMGDGVTYSFYNLTSCVGNGNRTLPSSHLRAVNGDKDQFLAGSDQTRTQDQALTGYNCGTSAFSCLQSNGSGWYIVQDSQVQDGTADHCYMLNGGCTASALDQNWLNGTAPWSMGPNLDWLKTFTQP